MPTSLSLDLRVRVLAAVASGLSHRQVGERFGVSAASVSRWRALEREQGSARAKQMGGDQRSQHIEAHGDLILSLYEATPDISLQELRAALVEHGVTVGLWGPVAFLPSPQHHGEKRRHMRPSRRGPTS
jgi:transposase